MFKFIGVVTVLAAAGLGAAIYTDVLDFDASAKVTAKGEQELRELRNSAADAIRDAGNSAGGAVESQPK